MSLERIDKLMADTGEASRKEARLLIKSGRVTVNGQTAVSPEEKYETDGISLMIDGRTLDFKSSRYIMMYKPDGVLSATEDRVQNTVLDLLAKPLQKQELFPVGRLDKDTTGLLLLTNDGEFSHRITSPKHHIAKKYRAAVTGVLDSDDIEAFRQGIELADGMKCLPAGLEIISPSVGVVTVYEGKFHQVKRMFAARRKYVTALHRLSIGGLALDGDLRPGDYRELTKNELELIFTK